MSSTPPRGVIRPRQSKTGLNRGSPSRAAATGSTKVAGGVAKSRTPTNVVDDGEEWEDEHSPKPIIRKSALPPSTTTSTRRRSKRSSWPSLVRSLLSPTVRLSSLALSTIWSLLFYILPFVFMLVLAYLTLSSVRNFFNSWFPLFRPRPFSSLASGVVPVMSSLYCSTIGLGCSSTASDEYKNMISRTTRTTAVKIEQARDVFDTLLRLGDGSIGDGSGLELHPVEMWELATAVKYSGLEEREFLGGQLNDLGNQVRVLKDSIIELNSLGINSLTWVVHHFSRVESLLQRAHLASASSSKNRDRSAQSSTELTKLIDDVFEQINSSLEALLKSLEAAIPAATRASDQSRLLHDHLRREEHTVDASRHPSSLVRMVLESGASVGVGGFKARQLRKDLDLTRQSAASVSVLNRGLEDTRSALLEYKFGVGSYKASVIGYQLGGSGLSAEDEVEHLGKVMADFKRTLEEVKQRGGGGKAKGGVGIGKTLPMGDGAV